MTKRPVSPPTPSPTPFQYNNSLESNVNNWTNSGSSSGIQSSCLNVLHRKRQNQNGINDTESLTTILEIFKSLPHSQRQKALSVILDACTKQQVSFVTGYVSPKLKKDFLKYLPTELALKVLTFIDDPKSLSRASQVSKHWNQILNDDFTWKILCAKYKYRNQKILNGIAAVTEKEILANTKNLASSAASICGSPFMTYKTHFRHKYLVETAWRTGGRHIAGHLTSDPNPVVTVLHLTDEYVIAGLDNSKIYLFGLDGRFIKTLLGHESGVWALCPFEEILTSGGCDRYVRVWNMQDGNCLHVLSGHTSTVRCIKVVDRQTAVSGSRDATLRVWNIEKGICLTVLSGHIDSVRCLQVHENLCVSGSYDTTARLWDFRQGTCLKTLHGHLGQIYEIVFNGEIIVTGSLDTTIRIWDVQGNLLKILQGHTSLVGQLQLKYPILVSGGSDGSVRTWDLEKYECVLRIAAHDNSVTSIQFDDKRIMSGGRDGRVKVWDAKSGTLIRELIEPAEEVWRIAFTEELAVVASSRSSRISFEIISFSPVDN